MSQYHKTQIAIIGAGQAGSQLAIELLQNDFDVTLFNNRSAEQILNGKILSSQGMFDSALVHERRLGLNFWDSTAPKNTIVSFSLAAMNSPEVALHWKGKTRAFYQSIDQRLKFSRFMDEFVKRGGELIIQDVNTIELNHIAKNHDLTIVAAGKGEIGQLFDRDDALSCFDKPQRALACFYLKNVHPENSSGVCANIIPGIGEVFLMPGLTKSGTCEMLLMEGLPQGAFDCWKNDVSPQENLNYAKNLLKQHAPWVWERCQHAELTDEQATLIGAFSPTIKNPIKKLSCGKTVFGLGDTVVLNDPVAGQGANTAARAAAHYAKEIINRKNKFFDEEWMTKVFNDYWNHDGVYSTEWSNMLLMPPPAHVIDLLGAASINPKIANLLAEGFNNPGLFFPWIKDPQETKNLIASFEQQSSVHETEHV